MTTQHNTTQLFNPQTNRVSPNQTTLAQRDRFADCIDLFGCVPGRVPNSTLVPGHGLLQTCKNACLQSRMCVAFDNDFARNSCYIITDVTTLNALQQVNGFLHYPLRYRCPRPVDSQYRRRHRIQRQLTSQVGTPGQPTTTPPSTTNTTTTTTTTTQAPPPRQQTPDPVTATKTTLVTEPVEIPTRVRQKTELPLTVKDINVTGRMPTPQTAYVVFLVVPPMLACCGFCYYGFKIRSLTKKAALKADTPSSTSNVPVPPRKAASLRSRHGLNPETHDHETI
ncbi:hypothetical protein LSAT2_007750 [Lamellibrachia satsuma]|nr:hypothetical protein LSAT2_007750 [Lamellibrachia satsuma]